MDAIFERHDRAAAIREFGPSRVLGGINRLYRSLGLDMLTDDAQRELLARLVVDEKHQARLAAESRAHYASHPASTNSIVAAAHAKQIEAIIDKAFGRGPALAQSEIRGH